MNFRNNLFKDNPGTINIVIITALVYLAVNVFDGQGNLFLFEKIALFSPESPSFKLYQIFTHFFVTIGLFNLLFTLLALFLFGISLERILGTKRFLLLFLGSGVGTGLALLALRAIGFSNFDVFFGNHGAFAGFLIAVAMIMPNSTIFMFPIPFPIKAKYAVPAVFAFAIITDLIFFKGVSIYTLSKIVGALVGFSLVQFWKSKNII